MNRTGKRILAVVLTVVMVFTAFPAAAFASLLGNDPAYNKEILNALQNITGSEDEAQAYYDVMQQYGLLDEDGNAVESWSILMDGEEITSDELREILAGDYDPDKYISVDGTFVTLDNVKTMLEIEDYISYIQETYYSDKEWTPEQITGYESLVAQVQSRGITLQTAGAKSAGESLIGASGFDHNVRMSFDESINNVHSNFTSYLNQPQEQTYLNEYWYFLDGSLCLGGDEDMNLRKDRNLTAFSAGDTTSISGNGILGTSMARTNNYTYPDYPTKVVPVNGKWSVVCFATDTKTMKWPDRYRYLYDENGCDRITIPIYVRESEGNYAGIYPYSDYSGDDYNPDIHYQIIQTVDASEFNSTAFTLHAVRGPKEICDTIASYDSDPEYYNNYLHYDSHNITFGPGSSVPIVLFFSKPVKPGATIVVNGKTLTNLEECPSTNISFLYPVQEAEDDSKTTLTVSKVTATDTNNSQKTWTTGWTLNNIHFSTRQHKLIFKGMRATIGGSVENPTMDVTVQISDNANLTEWIDSSRYSPNSQGGFTANFAKVTIDGEHFYYLTSNDGQFTGGVLTASIQLERNTTGSAKTYVAELYLEETTDGETNSELVFGQAATATQESVTFVTAADMTLNVSVQKKDKNGNLVNYFDENSNGTIYAQDKPIIKASYTLATHNPTYAYPTVKWSSTNTNVATIDENTGAVTIKGPGKVKFRLTATNGGYRTEYKDTDVEYTFGTGLTPYLYIPNSDVQSVNGKDVTVYWSTNLCEKNGATATNFTVKLKRGSNVVYTKTVSSTSSDPVSGYTISGSDLTFDYVTAANNIYTLEVSAAYQGKTYADAATISLESLPAHITLAPQQSYYILDTAGSVNISWDVANFERFSAAGGTQLFKVLITKGDQTVKTITNPSYPANFTANAAGHYTGNVTLDNLAFNANSTDKNSYRQVYTVTVQAKNGTDSTWSYDSYILYVYDADALKLWVDGADTNNLSMSNVSRISQMTQDQILALKRDIALRNVISANYGDYAWRELADQLLWASSNNDVATVNYQQGTLYEDIRNLSYTSYRATSEFVVSGLSDGQTTVTARHVLTGMTDSVNVTVQTLKNKLYLFQCYPQVRTALTYKDSAGTEKIVYSDNNGAAAIYEENGIQSDVYCRSTGKDGNIYLGTFYLDQLVSGERDSTQLELYPCNNLQLRRAAYAYLYLKKPDGTPYTGKITFRGSVYVNGSREEAARFALNSTGAVNISGDVDRDVTLGSDGKLEVVMDQTQWGLPGNQVSAGDQIHYKFLIKQGNNAAAYYPIFADIDATVNQSAFVESGDAIVNFRDNTDKDKKAHPFVIEQYATVRNLAQNYSQTEDILDSAGSVGPSDSLPETELKTVVMWWGDSADAARNGKIKLFTETGVEIAPTYSSQSTAKNGFVDEMFTTYTVPMNKDSLNGSVDSRVNRGTYLEYYRDGANLCRKETLSLRVCNLLGMGKVEDSDTLTGQLQRMGMAMGTSAKTDQGFGDKFVNKALELVASDNFSEGRGNLFKMKIAPTADPTKFLGFVEVNVGNMEGNVTGVYADTDAGSDSFFNYKPGFKELSSLFAMRKGVTNGLQKYAMQYMEDYNKALLHRKLRDISYEVQGYMETLIYFDFASGDWKMTVLDGGFDVGGGVSFSWQWNYMVGPVPFNVELKVGGTAEVNMDAITTAYKKNSTSETADFGTEYLTELRVYLYLKLFAGLGIDYSVVALKIGIFGQIDLDMRFRWLNRPYLEDNSNAYLLSTGEQHTGDINLNGQYFKINGTIGLEIIVKFLFISYEKALFSYTFNLLDKSTGDWEEINTLWAANQKNLLKAICTMLNNGSASTTSAGGRQMLALNLAPTVEDRDYLEDGNREWNTPVAKKGLAGLFKAPARVVTGVSSLQTNSYPYANPELSADGELLVYLSDQDSADVTFTRAAFATKNGTGYAQGGAINDEGYGDSQLVVDGTSQFAVSAWTRQTVDIQKDAGSVLTNEDQMMMLNGTEVYASVYNGSMWTTVRLTQNGGADVAPAVAVNGDRAIVAWRSVVAGDAENILSFDQKDTILYRIYENGAWSEAYSLYNGTSGEVKGITAVMMEKGTSAVAYTLDTDSSNETIVDREIVYAVIGTNKEVVRNVRATTDEKLDENPQLAVVRFPMDGDDTERFVLGWFSQTEVDGDTLSDINLFDFDASGITGQKMPQSLSEATADSDVSIGSNFRFSKNAEDINNLSIVWVERDEGTIEELADGVGAGSSGDTTNVGGVASEKDVLRGIKFFTYGANHELIGFTGALNVAEMPDATLIDHFDAYTTGGTSISAAVLGTTYGKNGATETKIGETVAGDTVSYTVPKATSAMYIATDSYEDKIEVGGLMADYETIKLGTDTQIRLCVRNSGINAVNKLTIKIGNTTTVFDDLNLLPGSILPVWADYEVPEDKVVDAAYTVTAAFANTGNITAAGTVYLDFADLQITDAAIMEEADGQRVIQVKLNNGSDAALANSGRSVRISFYSDPTFETPIDAAYLPAVTVTNNADLKMIDEGGYSVQTAFDVAAYVKGDSAETVEIPESGVPVYILAEVIRDGEVDPEFVTANNCASITCDNLKARTGQDVTLTSDLAIAGEGDASTTTVTVNMQNTRLGETSTGNLIVTLLDENGEVIEQKQSYRSGAANNGLLTLGGEAKATETFTFSAIGADAQVTYSDVVLDYDNVKLGSLTFSNIPGITLDSFTEQVDGTFAATATVNDVTSTSVMAVAESAYSTVSVKSNGQVAGNASNAASETVSVNSARSNIITVTVTSHNGDTRDYVLTLLSRKSVLVSADAKEKTYGETDPELTYTVTGLVEDDAIEVALTRETGENVGSYSIFAEISADDAYIVTYQGSELTINQRPIFVTVDAQEKTYGEDDPALTWQQEGLVDGDSLNVTISRETGEDVGAYTIDADVEVSDNYTPIIAPNTLTINKRALTITAEDKEKIYGDADPEFTWKQEGLVDGDTLSVTLTRAEGKDIGVYAIAADIQVSDNYSVTYIPANLTVNKRTLIVKADTISKVYGEEDPVLTYQMIGLVDGDTVPVKMVREPGEDVGTYKITTDVDAGNNYIVSFTGANLTITKKTLSVLADAKAKTYGETDPELTYTVTGLVGDDALTGALTREPGEAKGTYAILQGTVSASDNYTIDYTDADLTIAEKTINVTAHAKSKIYGAADPELTYTVEGLEDGDEMTGALSRAEGEAAGVYAITLGTLSAGDNYAINYTGAQFTVETKTVTVKADAKTKVYGNDDPELTYTVKGLKDGDEITVILTREPGKDVGTYAISAEILGAENYDVTYIPANLTIIKRPLKVTAKPASKREDKHDPKLNYTVDGLVEGDEISVTLSREPGEDVGRYAITAEIDAGDNYDVTYVGATFRIESKYCPLCGELHDKNIFDRILGCIHRFIYWIRNFFRAFSSH